MTKSISNTGPTPDPSEQTRLHPHEGKPAIYAGHYWTSYISLENNPTTTKTHTLYKNTSKHEAPFESKEKLCEYELQRRVSLGILSFKSPWYTKVPIISRITKRLFAKRIEKTVAKQKETSMRHIAYSAQNRPDLTVKPQFHSDEGNSSALSALGIDPSNKLLETRHIFTHNSPVRDLAYKDEYGNITKLDSAISSSMDRSSPTIHMMRRVSFNTDQAQESGESICYTGRPDNRSKALEQLQAIFWGELSSSSPKGLRLIQNSSSTEPTYELTYTVHSLLSTNIGNPDKKMLDGEIKALRSIQGKEFRLTDPKTGETYRVKAKPLLFSREFNFMDSLRLIAPNFISGSSISNEINKQSFPRLRQEVYGALEDLILAGDTPENTIKYNLIKSIYSALESRKDLKTEEELALHHVLSTLINVAAVYHCKSSTDRTGLAVALASALSQYLKGTENTDRYPRSADDILSLLEKEEFKELYFSNLTAGHQISKHARATEGKVGGKEFDPQNIGLKYRGAKIAPRLIENPVMVRLMPKRFLKVVKFPIAKPIAIAFGAIATAVYTAFYIASNIIRALFYYPYKRFIQRDFVTPIFTPYQGWWFLKNLSTKFFPKYNLDESNPVLAPMQFMD